MAPQVVGTPTTAAATGAGATLTLPVPAGVQDGDLLVAALRSQAPTATQDWSAPGWTRLGPAFEPSSPGGRVIGFYALAVPAAADAPTEVTFAHNETGANRRVGTMFIVRGADLNTPVAGFFDDYRGTGSTTTGVATLAFPAPDDTLVLTLGACEATAGNSHQPTGYPTATLVAERATGDDLVGSRTYIGVCSSQHSGGAVGVMQWSWTNITGASCETIALAPASDPPPPETTVEVWTGTVAAPATVTVWDGTQQLPATVEVMPTGLDVNALLETPQFRIAHRGGGGSWPEMTLHAYTQAVRARAPALEVSVWRTLDGVFVCHHDESTIRMTGVDLLIPSSTWDQVQDLMNTAAGTLDPSQPAQPMARLEDILDVYLHSHTIFLDPKQNSASVRAAVWDLLDSRYGTPTDRLVVKNFQQSVQMAVEARQRGYTTWGYFYNDQVEDSERVDAWDLLGLNWDADPSHWATAVSTGKPVIAHVITTEHQAGTAFGLGAAGIMMSTW